MKKVLIVGIVILLVLVIISIIYKNNNTDNNSITSEVYNKYKEDVDGGVEYFRESEYFNKMNEDNQIREMNSLLKIYENNKIIKNLSYDNANKMFSFIYNYGEIKGALGGVSFKKWDSMMN